MSEEIKVVITVNEAGITCESGLTPAELVYWLEVAKKVILEDSLDPPQSES